MKKGEPEHQWKWVESKLPKSDHPEKADIIINNAREIHFVYAWRKKSVHFKIHLQHLIPKDIYDKYAENNITPGAEGQDVIQINEDCNECKEYEKEVQRLSRKVDDLLRNQSRLEIDRRGIEQREERLREKKEAIKDELEKNKAELAKLRGTIIDTTKYMEWDADKFVDYICTVEDGRFLKYEDMLRNKFKSEGVSGEAIPHLEKDEWREFGIKNYMDRTKLHICIKDLVQ